MDVVDWSRSSIRLSDRSEIENEQQRELGMHTCDISKRIIPTSDTLFAQL